MEDMGVTFGVRLGGVDSVALYGSTLSVSDFSRVYSVCHCCMSKEWQMAMESAGAVRCFRTLGPYSALVEGADRPNADGQKPKVLRLYIVLIY